MSQGRKTMYAGMRQTMSAARDTMQVSKNVTNI
jgi:hypothetical protein